MEKKAKFYERKWFKITAIVLAVLILLSLLIDTSAPVIELKDGDSIELSVGETLSSEELVNAVINGVTDNRSDMSMDDVQVSGYDKIDFNNEGKYKLKFTTTDQAGNEELVPFTVKVTYTDEQLADLEANKLKEKETTFSNTVKSASVIDEDYIQYFEASNTSRFQYGSAKLDGKKWKTVVYYLDTNDEPKNADEIIIAATSDTFDEETMVAYYSKTDDSWLFIDAKDGIQTDEYGVPEVPTVDDANIEVEFTDFVSHLSDSFFEGYGIDRTDVI